ncbi:hypothetical protein [Pedobacter gandavensis]|uniref:hypothetical protein n=1 Tax=Pedobacter gandavensis TaxID=2679963 RepID=UPI00292EAD30|nr:hypothetical protein [Pedobacter gandavensis]
MSMIQQADFLRNHNLNSADFKASNLNYEELLNISADFESKRAAYDEIGTGVVKILFKFDAVHAIRYELNNSEELITKLIAYQLENPEVNLDLTNYETLVDNLINIKIIPLFKSDWAKIHESIVDQFVVIGSVTANVRAEDTAVITKEFTDKGCNLNTQADGYRSVDYVIKTAPSKKEYKVAVQVRSIFEEGWAEIDRSARYEHKTGDLVLNGFSKTLDKLAGGAAETGESIHALKSYLAEKESLIQEQQAVVQEHKSLVEEQQALVEAQKTIVLEQQIELADLRAQLAQVKSTPVKSVPVKPAPAPLEEKAAEIIPVAQKQLLSNGSDGMIGKNIIEDLAKTAAGIAGGSLSIENKEENTAEGKPKTVKNRTDKPKAVKVKEEKINAEKPRLEVAQSVVEDLFGQTRIPDAAPLKPSNTNA